MEVLMIFMGLATIALSGVFYVVDHFKLYKEFWCVIGFCLAFTYCVFITSLFFK